MKPKVSFIIFILALALTPFASSIRALSQKIEKEIKLYAKQPASPFGGEGGNSGSEPEEQDGIEGEETEPKPGEEPNPKTNANAKKDKALDILKSKSQIAIETLKEFYSFEDSEPAKAQ